MLLLMNFQTVENKMNGYCVLEPTLKDILEVVKPLREDWEVRSKIIEELKDVVASVESLRGATVEPFGSFVSNLFTRWGDLDISIVLSNGSYISSAGKKRKQHLLGELLRALRQRGGWRRLQFVPNARVPILKFESGRQSISCDISIDNLQGQMKSNFLFWINQIDGRFRDMVLLVKEWAKAHNINNPKSGTLNSYSLSLLVIFHFQTCVPAILPPLKEIYPTNAVDDLAVSSTPSPKSQPLKTRKKFFWHGVHLISKVAEVAIWLSDFLQSKLLQGVRMVAEERIKEICNANISRYVLDKYREVNRSSLSELFISFLAKFADIHLKATELGICTFTGQWEDIKHNMRWLPRTYALFIEDPFEQPENTARAVNARNLEKICEAFQTSYNRLVLARHNSSSLLSMLVGPQILNFIAGTPVGRSSYTSMDFRSTHPIISRAVHSESQVQHQIQNTNCERHTIYFNKKRQETHPNILSMQMQETHPTNSNLRVQRPIQNTRLEKHPTYVIKQRQESYPDTIRLENHPNNFTKQRQGSRLHNSTKQSRESYPSQGQHIWRPKSDG